MELAAPLPAPFRLGVWFFIVGLITITLTRGTAGCPDGPSEASGPLGNAVFRMVALALLRQ